MSSIKLTDATIEKLGVFVLDFERGLSFYKQKLGLKTAWESPEDGNAGFLVGYNLLVM